MLAAYGVHMVPADSESMPFEIDPAAVVAAVETLSLVCKG
jgi:hypothetical protein